MAVSLNDVVLYVRVNICKILNCNKCYFSVVYSFFELYVILFSNSCRTLYIYGEAFFERHLSEVNEDNNHSNNEEMPHVDDDGFVIIDEQTYFYSLIVQFLFKNNFSFSNFCLL
jgi:hypothetical protein